MRGLNTKRLLAASAGLVLVLGVAACGDDDDDDGGGGGGEAQLDLVIGDSHPAHGRSVRLRPPGREGSRSGRRRRSTTAIKEAGVDHTVKVVHEDNETNPQAAVQAARKLVDSDGATCITGAWASADTIPTAQSVSIPDGILQISPASTSDEITALDDDGLLNRTSPPDIFQGPTLADAIAEDLGGAEGKTVNIGARNDSYGDGSRRHVQGGVGGAGRHDRRRRSSTTPSSRATTRRLQQITEGNPDAFVIIDFPETFVKVGPALAAHGQLGSDEGAGAPTVSPPAIVAGRRRRGRSSRACAAPRRARPTRARPATAFDNALRGVPSRRTSSVRRSTPSSSTRRSSATSPR